jgi:tRNA threonylcarbamoyladenosine biosynthesis protein TsaB
MLLGVDTSTAQMGLALADGNQIAAESIWHSHQHHTVELAPALMDLLRHAGATMDDVDGVAIASGPGSFTALRVGMALVKGLAVARNLPVVGVPTLDLLAAGVPASTLPLAAVLQAGRGRIAVAWYRPAQAQSEGRLVPVSGGERAWQAQGAPEITTLDALARSIERPTAVAGELTSEDRQRLARKKVNVLLLPPHLCVRRPSLLIEIGRERLERGQEDDVAALTPLYLYNRDPVSA